MQIIQKDFGFLEITRTMKSGEIKTMTIHAEKEEISEWRKGGAFAKIQTGGILGHLNQAQRDFLEGGKA